MTNMTTQEIANLKLLETAMDLHDRLQQANGDSPFVKGLERFIQGLRPQTGNRIACRSSCLSEEPGWDLRLHLFSNP